MQEKLSIHLALSQKSCRVSSIASGPQDAEAATRVFCKKGVLRNFAKFTGKHLRESLFFNKIKKIDSDTRVFLGIWRNF